MAILSRDDLFRLATTNPDEPRAKDMPPVPEMRTAAAQVRALARAQERLVQHVRTFAAPPSFLSVSVDPSAAIATPTIPADIWDGTVAAVDGEDVRAIRTVLESNKRIERSGRGGRKPTASRSAMAEAAGEWIARNGTPMEHGEKERMVQHMLKACRNGLSRSTVQAFASELITAFEAYQRITENDG